ncbi:MAG: LLM class flavin-dependent oxidoreductase [Actinomycetota bacterium]|nr:LLM class flavin-dependent oxidoreductase [Actinomycetota bacterium]
MLLADSQNLQAEVFVELAFAVRATERVKLGTGVTNPLTRHPAVTAAAAATLEAESGGRTVLGVGRGDSAVTFVGARPAPVAVLEEFVRRLQRYLRGEVVGSNGFPSRLEWLPTTSPRLSSTSPRPASGRSRLPRGRRTR